MRCWNGPNLRLQLYFFHIMHHAVVYGLNKFVPICVICVWPPSSDRPPVLASSFTLWQILRCGKISRSSDISLWAPRHKTCQNQENPAGTCSLFIQDKKNTMCCMLLGLLLWDFSRVSSEWRVHGSDLFCSGWCASPWHIRHCHILTCQHYANPSTCMHEGYTSCFKFLLHTQDVFSAQS